MFVPAARFSASPAGAPPSSTPPHRPIARYGLATVAFAVTAFGGCAATASAAVEPALPAHGFRESIGINMHPDYTGTPESTASITLLEQRLNDLGIHHVRGAICDSGTASGCTATVSAALQGRMVAISKASTGGALKWLIGAGKLTSTDDPVGRATRTVTGLTTGQTGLGPRVEAFEGVNEPAEVAPSGVVTVNSAFVPKVLQAQSALANARATVAGGAYASLPVASAPVAHPSAGPALAGSSANVDIGAWHSYRSYDSPDRLLDAASRPEDLNTVVSKVDTSGGLGTCKVGSTIYTTMKDCNTAVYGNKPLWLTETGYAQCTTNYFGTFFSSNYGLSEPEAAAYIPRLVFDSYRLGFARTYQYDLMDQTVQNGDCRSMQYNAGDWWGLVRADVNATPKPSYTALKNALNVVGDADVQSTTGSLNLTINSAAATPLAANQQRHVLLRRADGTYVLALWATDGFRASATNLQSAPNNSWGPTAAQPAPPAVIPSIVVGAAGGPWDITEYRPFVGSAAVQSAVSTNAVTTNLTYDVHLFTIKAH